MTKVASSNIFGNSNKVAARYAHIRELTAAVDWFRNQAIAPEALTIWTVGPDRKLRPPQSGDNRRSDLAWILSVDLTRAKIEKRVAMESLRREGGYVYRFTPEGI